MINPTSPDRFIIFRVKSSCWQRCFSRASISTICDITSLDFTPWLSIRPNLAISATVASKTLLGTFSTEVAQWCRSLSEDRSSWKSSISPYSLCTIWRSCTIIRSIDSSRSDRSAVLIKPIAKPISNIACRSQDRKPFIILTLWACFELTLGVTTSISRSITCCWATIRRISWEFCK